MALSVEPTFLLERNNQLVKNKLNFPTNLTLLLGMKILINRLSSLR